MVAGTFTRENTTPVSLERAWKAGILDGHNLLPKILSEYISSIELIGGDGGVGTVIKHNFTEAVKEFRYLTEKIEALDNENHIIKENVIEGGLIGIRLKSYSIETKFEAISSGGTLGKVTIEYDTLDDTPLSADEEEEVWKGLLLMIKAIESHLLENPTSYT